MKKAFRNAKLRRKHQRLLYELQEERARCSVKLSEETRALQRKYANISYTHRDALLVDLLSILQNCGAIDCNSAQSLMEERRLRPIDFEYLGRSSVYGPKLVAIRHEDLRHPSRYLNTADHDIGHTASRWHEFVLHPLSIRLSRDERMCSAIHDTMVRMRFGPIMNNNRHDMDALEVTYGISGVAMQHASSVTHVLEESFHKIANEYRKRKGI